MIGAKCRTKMQTQRVRRRLRRGSIKSLGHAAASLRLIARRSIRSRKGPSSRGSPPHTHTKRLPSSILYDVDRSRVKAIVGPSHRIVGIAGAEHEHGRKFRKEALPARPFMAPALEKAKPKLPRHWSGCLAG